LYEVAEECGILGLVGDLPPLAKIVDRYHNPRAQPNIEDEPLILQ
jgi:hypothetical protein